MTTWLSPAIMSLLSFGLWGLFSKITMPYIGPKSALVFQTAGVLAVGLIALKMVDYKPDANLKGISYALLTGLAYGAGCLFYLIAADRGKVTTVVTMTALYPLVTIVLSYLILSEEISLKQYSGIVCALVAMYLMAT